MVEIVVFIFVVVYTYTPTKDFMINIFFLSDQKYLSVLLSFSVLH